MKTAVRHMQRGVSLIELVMAIVLISIGLAGILTVINQSTMHSADPMMLQQGNAIAQSYLEEILLHPYRDPDDNALCGLAEGTRAAFDDVCDYTALPDTRVRDKDGGLVAGTEDYRINVAVDNTTLGPVGTTVNALRVVVTVTHVTVPYVNITLTGFRADYD